MPVQNFTAVIHKEDDLYIGNCLEIGTVSQGHTVEEAIANLEEFPMRKGAIDAN